MRRTFDWLLVLSLSLAPALPSFAQTFGQITGLVTDTSGAILVGASVSITNAQTGATRTAETNRAGSYVVPNLLPGVYNVKVEVQGFRSELRNGVCQKRTMCSFGSKRLIS